MVQTYSDIAARPQIPGYPLVNQQTSDDARDAADFERILRTHRQEAGAAANPAPTAESGNPFLSFLKGVIDIINPLQHIPVVSTLYRHFTGDEISPAAHFIGDALYGGPLGGAVAAVDIAYEKTTGQDMGATVLASMMGGKKAPDTQIAQNLEEKISPAAGAPAGTPSGPNLGPAHENIIWSDAIVRTAQAPLFPPSLPQGTNGEEPVSPLETAQPALPKSVASTNTLQAQEAPVDAARKTASPELIASKMMEGLEKYAQMKRSGLAPTLSAAY